MISHPLKRCYNLLSANRETREIVASACGDRSENTWSIMEPGTFSPTLLARIRALQYLHFFCLPDKNRPGRAGSIIRLDRVFPTYLGRGLAPMDEKIHEEPFEILLSQFSILSGAVYREPYELARELVKDALPAGLDT